MMDGFLWLSLLIGLPAGYGFYHLSGGGHLYRAAQHEGQVSLVQQRMTTRFGIFLLILSLILLVILCGMAFFFNGSIEAVVELISLAVIEAFLILGVNILIFTFSTRRKN